jgi:hypothetical protein
VPAHRQTGKYDSKAPTGYGAKIALELQQNVQQREDAMQRLAAGERAEAVAGTLQGHLATVARTAEHNFGGRD